MTSRWNKRRRVRTPVSYAVYYSDGQLHASGIMQDLTEHGGCVSGTHVVTVGMQLMVLLIRPAKRALMIKNATVRWVRQSHFGVELDEANCGMIGEFGDADTEPPPPPLSIQTH
jgi:PilZ domain-containing protein